MKMKKMIGAVALTAALAMGSVPAFAASASNDAADNAFSDSGSTEIRAKVDNVDPNVRATVPLKVVVVMGATGGGQIMGPSADSYKITNIGDGDINVTDAELTDFNSVFTSQIVWENSAGNWVTGTSTNGTQLTSGDSLMFTLAATSDETGNEANVYLTTDHKASDQGTSAAEGRPLGGNPGGWEDMTIAAQGGELPLTLGGNYYFTSTLDSGELTDALCKIKYTIAAA